MPYFLVAAAFAMFTVGAAIGTVFARVFVPLRSVFPFVWRIWLWGSLGFLVANALFLLGFWSVLLPVMDVKSLPSWLHGILSVVAGVTVVLGPFIISGVGVGGGALLGCVFAWRSGRDIANSGAV